MNTSRITRALAAQGLALLALCSLGGAGGGAPAWGQVLHDNGPLSTGPVTNSGVAAPAGTNWSEVQNNAGNCAESNTVAGFAGYLGTGTTNFRLADDFTVPAGATWIVNEVCVYGYRTGGSPTVSPFSAANLRIWNGRPGDAGSVVLFGDLTTNRLASSQFEGLYRIFNSTCPPPGTAPGTTRAIWRADITANLTLGPGTYWIDFQTVAPANAVHFHPSVTLVGQRGLPGWNGRQSVAGVWQDAIDAGNPATAPDVPQDLPFQIKGLAAGGLRIDAFTPPAAGEGDLVTIVGAGFGNNPDNICAAVMNGPNAIGLRVLQANDQMILAEMGPVPPNAKPGPLMVGLGTGMKGTFDPVFKDIIPEDPMGVWVWDRNDGAAALAPNPFNPIPRPPPPGVQWIFGEVVNGRLCIVIDKAWMPNTYVRVQARAHNHAMRMGADLEARCIRFRLGGSAEFCAARICDTVRCAFLREGILVNCSIEPIPGTSAWKITIVKKGPGGQPVPIDWGNFNVCTRMPIKIRRFGFDFTAFFNADLQDITAGARIGNLGSSGQDGASITLLDAPNGANITLAPVNLNPAGAEMTIGAWGTFDGVPNQCLGSSEIRHAAFFDVFADFTPIGAPMVRVQTVLDGQVVGQQDLPAGMLGRLLPPPSGVIVVEVRKLPPRPMRPPCHGWVFPGGGMAFQAPGLPPLAPGNELRVLALGAPGAINTVDTFDIAAGGLLRGDGAIVVTGVTLNPPPCAVDLNGDGQVTIADFLEFLNLFSAGDPRAEFDGVPGITVGDFLAFLNAFSAGC